MDSLSFAAMERSLHCKDNACVKTIKSVKVTSIKKHITMKTTTKKTYQQPVTVLVPCLAGNLMLGVSNNIRLSIDDGVNAYIPV